MDYRIYVGLGPSVTDVIKVIYSYFKLDYKEFKKKSIRKREYDTAKKLTLYFFYKKYKINTLGIERLFNIDHSTTLNALRKTNNYLETDKQFKKDYNAILLELNKLNVKDFKHLN